MNLRFLPVCKEDMEDRGWEQLDFLFISGDAYVDHPSFAPAVICRVLEAAGYKVAILPQPDWRDPQSFKSMGKPRLGVLLRKDNLRTPENVLSSMCLGGEGVLFLEDGKIIFQSHFLK